MKFRFGCRGCPACNMNHKHQQCNFKKLIFFSPRKKENKISESASQTTSPLLTYSEQTKAGHSQSFWILREIPGRTQSMCGNRICSRRRMAPLAVLAYRWPCLHTHTCGTLAWGNGWLLVQIYICHHCSLSFGINFITGTPAGVYYSVWQQVWGCMDIVDSLSSWIRIYTVTHPFFRRAYLVHGHSYIYGAGSCTRPLVAGTGPYMSQPGLGVHSKRFGSKCLLLFILKLRLFKRQKCTRNRKTGQSRRNS